MKSVVVICFIAFNLHQEAAKGNKMSGTCVWKPSVSIQVLTLECALHASLCCEILPSAGFMLAAGMWIRNENSAQSFSDRSFWKSLRIADIRAFGSWMSALKCLHFHDFDRPDRSFGPGYPREWPPDVRGMSVPKTSSLGWFSFLSGRLGADLTRQRKHITQVCTSVLTWVM